MVVVDAIFVKKKKKKKNSYLRSLVSKERKKLIRKREKNLKIITNFRKEDKEEKMK